MKNPNTSPLFSRNQQWWDYVSGKKDATFKRSSAKDGKIKLFAFSCGWLKTDMKMMLSRERGTVQFPVPVYIIEHPKGHVLFDTGMHPESGTDTAKRIGELANFFQVDFREGEDIKSRLEMMDIDASKIKYLINSHLHFDHSGGNELVPNAKVYVQQKEWESAHIPELIHANGFNPKDYDHGHLVQQIGGEFDLFGDGTIVTIPTPGHTPGHQSLKLKLESGEIILAADACYFKRTLEELHLPGLVYNREQMIDSLLKLRDLKSRGARIFYGHDPEFWKNIPQAPMEVK